jgi:hypothetical protein
VDTPKEIDLAKKRLKELRNVDLSLVEVKEYTVSEGDYLIKVLRREFGLSDEIIYWAALKLIRELNPEVENFDILGQGQSIRIPSNLLALYEAMRREQEPAAEAKGEVEEPKASPAPMDGLLSSMVKALGGDIVDTGSFSSELGRGGQFTLDASSFPILELIPNKRVIMDFGRRLPPSLKTLVETELGDTEVLSVDEEEGVEGILDRLFSIAGYYAVDKGGAPVVVGEDVQVRMTGQWTVYKDELLRNIAVVNLIKTADEATLPALKEYVSYFGIELIDVLGPSGEISRDEGRQVPDGNISPAEPSSLDASSSERLIDGLLALVEQDYAEEAPVSLFRRDVDGFDLQVVVGRSFERKGKTYCMDFQGLPEQVADLIREQGKLYMGVNPDAYDPNLLIESFFSFLGLDYAIPMPEFSGSQGGTVRNVVVAFPGILLKEGRARPALLTQVDVDEVFYRFLGSKGIDLVRY